MSDVVIRVDNLSKQYRIGFREQYLALRDVLVDWVGKPFQRLRGQADEESPAYLWALRDITFDVRQGEIIGIIGHNGAGKSTLLKILSRITKPTRGTAKMRGRVGSLLEVGTGFHPELTGRENIYLSGAILGMRKAEIQRKFDEIVAFAETERFLETPVKRYSSGMYMRLAFSIAAHLEPEILIVDEVLAVGDTAFQKKCLGKMGSVVQEGRTVLFVSHNMPAVQSLCSRALLLEHGKLTAQGPTAAIVSQYLESRQENSIIPLEAREDRQGDGSVRVTSLQVKSTDPDAVIRSRSGLEITIGYRASAPVVRPQFVVSISDLFYTGLFVLSTDFVGGLPETLPPQGKVVCVTEPINLTPGRCSLHIEVMRGMVRADRVKDAATFDVVEEDLYGTGKFPPRDWALNVLDHQWRWLPDTPGESAAHD